MKVTLKQVVASMNSGVMGLFMSDSDFSGAVRFRQGTILPFIYLAVEVFNEKKDELLAQHAKYTTKELPDGSQGYEFIFETFEAKRAFEKALKVVGEEKVEIQGEPFLAEDLKRKITSKNKYTGLQQNYLSWVAPEGIPDPEEKQQTESGEKQDLQGLLEK